jgi:hypothetical protein
MDFVVWNELRHVGKIGAAMEMTRYQLLGHSNSTIPGNIMASTKKTLVCEVSDKP